MFHSFLYFVITLSVTISISFSWRINSRFGLGDQVYEGGGQKTKFGRTVQFIDQYFFQRLDHSRPTNTSQWSQRFFVNDIFYEGNGIIFLLIFGPSEATPNSKWMHGDTFWTSVAKKYNALCISLEHRYYGKSSPMKNISTDNLQYLTSEQALADIAYFIESMNVKYEFPPNTKWILFGGSYAGSLVTWARMKYPHLVHGAVASSAPLLAKMESPEYYHVERSLDMHDSNYCVENIKNASRELEYAVKRESGRDMIFKQFSLCDPIVNNTADINLLFENLARGVVYATQYNLKGFTTDDVCALMNDENFSTLDRYANVNKKFMKFVGETCIPHQYKRLIEYLQNEGPRNTIQRSSRLWTYQQCTEFGWFPVSSKPSMDLFGEFIPSLDLFISICKDAFPTIDFSGAFFDNTIKRTNIEYGGLKLDIENIALVSGTLDPWESLEITNRRDKLHSEVIHIEGTTHCSDMYSSSEKDSWQLKNAHYDILDVIKSWLVKEDDSDGPNSFSSLIGSLVNAKSWITNGNNTKILVS